MPDKPADRTEPPYYAVIFASQRRADNQGGDSGYTAMAQAMETLALAQPGCLGVDSARSADGFGLTVSYFADEASIAAWKANAEHLVAQKYGKDKWYEHYSVRVAKVERAYKGPKGR